MPAGPIVTSPFHLTVVELLRREVLGATVPQGAIPVDAFVFGLGGPPAGHLTKIGGAPYRSRAKPWPSTNDGRPLGFVGQLCFLDSADIVSGAPGDVLLIFVDPENLLLTSSYVFEWVKLGEEELITSEEVPEVSFTWRPGRMATKRGARPEIRRFAPLACHGVIYRTLDFPGNDALFAAYKEGYRVSVLEATKIGGVPRFIGQEAGTAGRFIGAVASVQPAPEVQYPWANQEAALSLADRHALPTWKCGDMGSVYLFERSGRVLLDAQSY
jgi:hypothetical protein